MFRARINDFKAEAEKLLNEDNLLVLESYQACPLARKCPFSDIETKVPCFGVRDDRNLKFVCDIITMIKERL